MRRADLLEPGILAALDDTPLLPPLAHCNGCGQILFTLGEVARHREVIDPGQPPTWENSVCLAAALAPVRLADDLSFWSRDTVGYEHEHLIRVHRLGHNGEPRYSLRFARHSPTCPCHTDSLYAWLIDSAVCQGVTS